MPSDPEVVARLREWFAEHAVTDERRMFGGVAFLDRGRIVACGSSRGEIMVRCDPERTAELADAEGVRPTVMRGRPMRGWLDVDPAVVPDEDALDTWLAAALAHTRTLPPT